MKLTSFFISCLIIFTFCRESQFLKQGYYTIVAPGTARSHSMFYVSISLSDFHKSCYFNLSIIDSAGETLASRTVDVSPETTKLTKLPIPYLNDKRGYFNATGYRGIISRNLVKIYFEHDSYSAFIQTSKAKYKPGELVQFRVIFIDQLTRPAEIQQRIFVLIYDGQENLIKHFDNVKLVQGVFKGEFQLSDRPVLGEWKLEVEVDGDAAAKKSFEVASYKLPKFFVNIKTKTNVAINEKKIYLEISASFFYGEPVKGNVTVLLKNTYVAFSEKLPLLKRDSMIDGKTTITLDIKNDLKVKNERTDPRSLRLYTFAIEAIVIHGLSGQQSRSESEIGIHSQPFIIKLQVPKVFEPDKFLTFKIQISVTDLQNNPIQDTKIPVKIKIQCSQGNGQSNNEHETVETEYIHQIGMNAAFVNMTNQNFTECNLYAEYSGSKSPTEVVKKNEDFLRLDILTESPEVGKELEMKLISKDTFNSFSYEIVSRGNIIQSEYIKIPGNLTTHTFRLNVTYAMVPKITVNVHRINNGIFNETFKYVHIKRAFQNSIEIKMNKNETKPGTSVQLNVTTDEGSYVGLMGLDHRLLQDNHKYDLTDDHVYAKLRNYDSFSIELSHFSGAQAGLVTFSNTENFRNFGSKIGEDETISLFDRDKGQKLPEVFDKPSIELPMLRKFFSETWLYKDFERSPAKGLTLLETVPDTITSWAITGFSLNNNTGLTLTRNSTNLKVFQEFFVTMDLPSSIKKGETVKIPIYISNYMARDALANLTIESDSEDLDIWKHPKATTKPKETLSKLISLSRIKIIFFIKPRKSGVFNVKITAISSTASDAIQKPLKVIPKGIPKALSKTYLVHFPEESTQEDEITIDIPENSVPRSQSIEVSVVGDVFRPLMRSILKLAHVPYGNAEDNMKLIIANSLVLKYLKALNHTSPSYESKVRLNLELGYQNQLCYKHLDGSFGLFDTTVERTGDIWQTAFALWGLKQASNFIRIDNTILERGLGYLKRKQQKNGCFKSKTGQEDVKLTAFGVMVFLMDDSYRKNNSDVISRGLGYLYKGLENLEHSSISAISTYVLWLGKHVNATDRFRMLTTNAFLTDKQMLWANSDTLQSNLETTASSLLNLLSSHKQPRQDLLHIVRGLITLEREESFITHMIALQEMTVFVEDLQLGGKNLTINLKDDQKGSGNFQVNFENAQVLQTLKLSHSSRKINIQSKGYGFAVVNVKYKYNLLPQNQSSSSYCANITTHKTLNSLTVIEFCAHLLESKNNLTIMEINLQSGFIFTEKALDILRNEFIKSIQFDANHEIATVYLENINRNGVCLKLEVLKMYKIFNAKPGWVAVYSAHKRDARTVRTFKIDEIFFI